MKTLSRDDVPLVILDTDATQKFAEIKVQWGKSLRRSAFRPLAASLSRFQLHVMVF